MNASHKDEGGRKMNHKTLFLVEVAVFSSLALLLDLVSGFIFSRIWPQGGSVSIAMVPIFLMAYRWGIKGGLSTGFLLGLLQVVSGTAWIAHPIQGFIDYFLAFTVVGISGVFMTRVTVDDILEEIVGEIRDEFDIDEVASIRKIKDGHYMFDAKVLVKEVNDLLGIHLNEEDVDTIGGWILTENYDVHENDIIEKDGFCFKVLEMEDHSIKCIEVTKNLERLQLENELNLEN